MKSITLFIVTLTAISLTACGNGGNSAENLDGNSAEGFDGNSFEKIDINVNCTSPNTVKDYLALKSGDQILNDESDSNISILHDQNGVKKVCLNSGKAHVVRAFEQ